MKNRCFAGASIASLRECAEKSDSLRVPAHAQSSLPPEPKIDVFIEESDSKLEKYVKTRYVVACYATEGLKTTKRCQYSLKSLNIIET